MHDSFQALLHLIIPEGVSDYFKLVDHKEQPNALHFYLEELNTIKVFSMKLFYRIFPSGVGRCSCMLNVAGG
ncbi:hypothetical protein [Solitalea lacus]|uniref:hypothetical protein n=1 Tax=Solitalea lacus TaxID=2911172 RepID=UPI001EDA7F89|nr:hypothetical protein [Solitalea lacus]UKJ07934.1 hypothetical protein L2B55_01920 [Solitalea lacus]